MGYQVRISFYPFWLKFLHIFTFRAARQAKLLHSFKFNCRCSACTSPDVEASDRKRTEINKIHERIPSVAMKDWRKTIEMVEKAVSLLREEGIAYQTLV